jgi:Bacterial protein of unknown function (DUF924)
VERLRRVVAMAERIALETPQRLRPLYRHSVGQARGHLDVISRFGRFPHRNPVLGRASTPEEVEYLDKGDFVHLRRPRPLGRSAEGKPRLRGGEARLQDGKIVGG